MIKLENTVVSGMEAAIRGMRNAKNSWDKADSYGGYCHIDELTDLVNQHVTDITDQVGNVEEYENLIGYYMENASLNSDLVSDIVHFFLMGKNDMKLASTLANAGADHGKFLRQIQVSVDITAPLFWWKEFDTYKVGTVANSTSTMHTITNTPITMENFSFETMLPMDAAHEAYCDMITVITICENYRQKFLEYKNTNPELANAYWRMLIELLPNGWLQKRTVTLNYAVLRNIYKARKNHKLTEWHIVCNWIENLPYANELIKRLEEHK